MEINIRFILEIDEDEVPLEYKDSEYFEEVICENIEDVFLGAGIKQVDIKQVDIDKKE